MSLPLTDLVPATFEPFRGETFRATAGDTTVDLRLAEVGSVRQAARAGGGFTLTFVGAPGPHLPQAIYPLAHGSLGTVELFLVPIGPTDGGNGYEAVFA